MSEGLAAPLPLAEQWRASDYRISGRAGSAEDPLTFRADPEAHWMRYWPFDSYKPGGGKRRVLDAGPHLDFLGLRDAIRRDDHAGLLEIRRFTARYGLLGLFHRYYRAQPVLPRGKPYIAPEAVLSRDGRLIRVDPATEGRALLSPGGRIDVLLSTERGRILLQQGVGTSAPVSYERIALPSEVSFMAAEADALEPLHDALPGELVSWEEAKRPFKAVLVLDEQAPARVSVLPTSEPVRLWTVALGFFELACLPEPGGDAEEEMIEEINLELAGTSPLISRREYGGEIYYERNWRCRSLLESMYLMLYLDVTGGNRIRKCQAPGCPRYFRMGSQSGSKYCPGGCASRATSKRHRERRRPSS